MKNEAGNVGAAGIAGDYALEPWIAPTGTPSSAGARKKIPA
jgi:hypothetical protein